MEHGTIDIAINAPGALTADGALRVFVATALCALVLLYGGKLLAQRLRDGRAAVFVGAPGGPAHLRRIGFRIAQAALPSLALARVFWPETVDAATLAFPLPQPVALPASAFGAALLTLGAGATVFSHNYMGVLWRSGVPDDEALERAPDALLQTGPFAVSRNPIFLGVITMQFGLLLAWPCALTLVAAVTGAAALAFQAHIEERTLRARFGPSYDAYCARVPRWI